ncbi:hypothetical protein DCC39_08710 [Pueribacillus theae]|uniref:Uncharacterized protein n=1 Tax=Pueribacillus theae TaxID=2171751 RepID=A0A2U1K3Z3_9BACI|nr:hypothetical protein [Pueribacillus theae]PWA11859.1 hypothetical protein DCC39_08710 [Pueribacillus theae]
MEKPSRKRLTIEKCLSHLDMLNADAKTKQIVYMYMAELYQKAYDEGFRQGQYDNRKKMN